MKNESELAYIMGMALKAYANKVENGLTSVWTPLLTGESTVTVNVTLGDDGSLAVAPLEEPKTESTGVYLDNNVASNTFSVGNTDGFTLSSDDEPVVEKPKSSPRRKKKT